MTININIDPEELDLPTFEPIRPRLWVMRDCDFHKGCDASHCRKERYNLNNR